MHQLKNKPGGESRPGGECVVSKKEETRMKTK